MTSLSNIITMFLVFTSFFLSAMTLPIDMEKRTSYTNARFTYFKEGGYGACGGQNSDYEHVVAINTPQWDGGKHCWELINISYNGKHTQAAIVDECPGCPDHGLDLTEGLFKDLAGSLEAGVLHGTWSFA